MLLQTLFSDPAVFIAWLAAMVLALTIHEFAHAWAGTKLGDMTAQAMGRLTLNPLAHISGIGLLCLITVGFGWGKPVPFNPLNLKKIRRDSFLIAVAGPISNLILGTVAAIILKLVVSFQLVPETNLMLLFLNFLVVMNIVLIVFNLLPLPPLDGSKVLPLILQNSKWLPTLRFLEINGPLLLIGLLLIDNVTGVNLFSRLFQGAITLVYTLLF